MTTTRSLSLLLVLAGLGLVACGSDDGGRGRPEADADTASLDWSQGTDPGSPDLLPDALPDSADVPADSADVPADPGPADAVQPDATPVCGDDACDATESCATCPDDCGACPWCGDGLCDLTEDCGTCPDDCGECAPVCGDDACTGDETCAECPDDCGECPATCPDASCDAGEDCHTCAADCGACPTCGDDACNGDEDCAACPDDCGACPACPDGACNGGESCASCPDDCGPCEPWCGDTSCNGEEDCAACPQDCGACPIDCGAGGCTPGETCDNCPADCGACPATLSFTPYWTETLSGPIVQGRPLRLRYDGARLPTCRGWKYGFPAWSLLLYYSFDLAGPATYVPMFVKSPVTGDMEPVEPVIDVPAGATDVWFWATNNDAFGCNEWDSDFGKNYHFPVFAAATVSQAVTWAGQVNFVRVTDGGYDLLGDVDPAFYWASMGGSEVATYIQCEVYVPGITDRAYADDNVTREVANTALHAVRRSDAYPDGFPGAELKVLPLEYWARAGNNFVYRWFPASLTYNVDPQHVPDGAYRYRFELSTADGAEVTSLGRPGANEQDRTMVLAQDTRCDLFPYNPPAGWCP